MSEISDLEKKEILSKYYKHITTAAELKN